MKILIIGDPISKLKMHSDTSIYIAETALAKGHDVFWATPEDLRASENEVIASFESLVLKNNQVISAEKSENRIDFFEWILVRKDPPVDNRYIELCWLLAPYESKIKFINKPSLLLRYHEKMIPFECMRDKVISEKEILSMTLVSSLDQTKTEIQKSSENDWVLKPFLGHGGEEIHLFKRDQLSEISKLLTGALWILQPLEPAVKSDGDYRAIFINGDYVGGFLRKPAENSIVSNLAQGGTAASRPLTSVELDLVSRLGKWLKIKGFFLAGADLIGGKLSEVNVTSPTGFKSFFKLNQISLAEKTLEEMEK